MYVNEASFHSQTNYKSSLQLYITLSIPLEISKWHFTFQDTHMSDWMVLSEGKSVTWQFRTLTTQTIPLYSSWALEQVGIISANHRAKQQHTAGTNPGKTQWSIFRLFSMIGWTFGTWFLTLEWPINAGNKCIISSFVNHAKWHSREPIKIWENSVWLNGADRGTLFRLLS